MVQSESPRWRLDRSINAGDLLVFLSLLAAGIGYVLHQDQRKTRNEDAVVALQSTDQRHDVEIKEIRDSTDKKLDRLDAKMDRLIEQHAGRP